MSASHRRYRPETNLVHAGTLRSQFGETSEALFLTQGYVYDSARQAERRFTNEEPGFQYSRFSNPTISMFEERMAALEGAEAARATATGMAAVTLSLLGQLKAGDHVVAAKAMFGSCRYVVEDFLPRYGIPSTLVDGTDLAQWRNAVRPETKTFFLESPTNPTLEIIDIAAVAKIAHEAGATLVVDNVFATPLFQSPLQLGADCVVYSATKHIDGQGRCLGGVILRIEGVHREGHPQLSASDRPGALALQCLGAAERPGDPAAARAPPDRERRRRRRCARRASEGQAPDLSRPAGPSAGGARAPPDEGGLHAHRLRGRRRQGRGLPLHERTQDRAYLEQSWRREKSHHPPCHHHP